MNETYQRLSDELARGARSEFDPRATERDIAALAAKRVIGCILMRPEVLATLKLATDDIDDVQARRVLDGMRALHAAGKPYGDPLLIMHTVCTSTESAPAMLAWLLDAHAEVLTAEMLPHYAGIVRAFAVAERLRMAAAKVVSATHNDLYLAVEAFVRLATGEVRA